MLLGYRPETGEIEFLFSDTSYLQKQFPGNSAKIYNFWKIPNHGLKEFFIDVKDFPDYHNYKLYKVINGKIIKKTTEEIQLFMNKQRNKVTRRKIPNSINNNNLSIPNITSASYIKSLEERINKLEKR